MTIEDVLFLDTETTGVPDRNAQWDKDFMDYPHVVQLAWIFKGKHESHLIIPEGYTIPEETTQVHGITTEMAIENGEPFVVVVEQFLEDCAEAGLICGHNIHFDTSIIKANIMRELGQEYYNANEVEECLFKGKRIDTMRPTMKWVDARTSNGRLKFPRLEELYSRCFPGESFPAHDALEDCKAVARCLPILIENGLVELKVKDYSDQYEQKKLEPEQKPASTETAHISPTIDSNSKDDTLTIQQEKVAQIENSAKITGVAAELLDQDNF